MKVTSKQIKLEELKDFDKVKTLKVIEDNTFHIINAPYNNTVIPVVVMMLNSVQIKAAGSPGIIALNKELGKENKRELNLEEMIQIKNTQEMILKMALISPTFEEISELIEVKDHIKKLKEELAHAKDRVEDTTPMTVEERKEKTKLLQNIQAREIMLSFLLPDDFMAVVTSFVLQIDNTDILKVSQDMLLEAALLSERYKKPAHDFISGVFTDYQKNEIDKCATVVFERFKEQKQLEKRTGKVIGGPKVLPKNIKRK